MSFFTRLMIALSLLVLPLVIVLVLGFLWLWEHELFRQWLFISFVWAGLAWAWILYLRYDYHKKYIANTKTNSMPTDIPTTPETTVLWQEITEMANAVNPDEYPLEDFNKLIVLTETVLQKVANHYKPNATHPILDISLPHLLRIAELVSADLQKTLSQNIPLSHTVSISNLFQGYQWMNAASKYYNLYRIASVPVNPVNALLREARSFAVEKMMGSVSSNVKAWVLKSYIEQVGHYSIRLYSGTLLLQDPQAIKQVEEIQKPIFAAEPLRILIIGQVGVGKSSLIDALLNQPETTVLPNIQTVTSYPFELDGLKSLLIETQGYETAEEAKQLMKRLKTELLNADFILLTCAANNAARDADKAALTEIYKHYQVVESQYHPLPPIILVVTHIDKLSPVQEWNPPYNLVNPQSSKKAQAICAVLDVIHHELQDSFLDIIAVNSAPDRRYNIEEGLLQQLLNHLPTAQNHHYIRCMETYQKLETRQLLVTQAKKAGQLVFDKANALVKKFDIWKK
ncbi:hypothetical protein BegalDRAFT_2641 [Beggiatoa alba B18LD]|uniref:G domain-containing protein n=1 Tax=Beggiatoa alba B18LD TaxID=395493 RepID=I3CIP0_9GAMM|nr:GTPase [Beggiatoa alba]EIJ43483.1 hypothetical protein BegalDRAFT_2641 [Beggiatoa alba B18LD]